MKLNANPTKKHVCELNWNHLKQLLICPVHTIPTQPSIHPLKLLFHSYHLQSRVLLSGIGADEMCGGYTRYYACFDKGGYSMAANEMKSDWNRLWFRNLVHTKRCNIYYRDEMTGVFRIMDEKCVHPIWMRM